MVYYIYFFYMLNLYLCDKASLIMGFALFDTCLYVICNDFRISVYQGYWHTQHIHTHTQVNMCVSLVLVLD